MVERRNFDKNWQQSWQQNHHLNNAWSRMKTWRILTAKLLFKHGNNPDNLDILDNPDNKTIVQTRRLVFTWSSASSSWVLVWNLLKSFWNYHHSERSTFEIIIIKKVILRSQLFPTCPKENGHRCLKSGWKQVGGTWSAVAAPPTRPPILCSMYAVRCGVVRWLLNLKGIFLSWWQLLPYLMRIGGHCAEEGHVDILEKRIL